MTNRELIDILLDYPMKKEVRVCETTPFTDEKGLELAGTVFDVTDVGEFAGDIEIRFKDWRKRQ